MLTEEQFKELKEELEDFCRAQRLKVNWPYSELIKIMHKKIFELLGYNVIVNPGGLESLFVKVGQFINSNIMEENELKDERVKYLSIKLQEIRTYLLTLLKVFQRKIKLKNSENIKEENFSTKTIIDNTGEIEEKKEIKEIKEKQEEIKQTEKKEIKEKQEETIENYKFTFHPELPEIKDIVPSGEKIVSTILNNNESSMWSKHFGNLFNTLNKKFNKENLYLSRIEDANSLTQEEAREIIKLFTDVLKLSALFFTSDTKNLPEKTRFILRDKMLKWLMSRLKEKITLHDIPDEVNDAVEQYLGEENQEKKEGLLKKITLWLTNERLDELLNDGDTSEEIKQIIGVYRTETNQETQQKLLRTIALWLTAEKETDEIITKDDNNLKQCEKKRNFKPHYYSSGLVLFLVIKALLDGANEQQKRQRLETLYNDLVKFFNDRNTACHKGFSVELLESLRGTSYEIITKLDAWILARGAEFYEELLTGLSQEKLFNLLIIWINFYYNADYTASEEEEKILSDLFGKSGINDFKNYLKEKAPYVNEEELNNEIGKLYNLDDMILQPVPGNRIDPSEGYAWLDNLYLILFGPQNKNSIDDFNGHSPRAKFLKRLRGELLMFFTPNIQAQYTISSVKQTIYKSIYAKKNVTDIKLKDNASIDQFITSFLRIEEEWTLFKNKIPHFLWGNPLAIQNEFDALYKRIIDDFKDKQCVDQKYVDNSLQKLSKLFDQAKGALCLEIRDFFSNFFAAEKTEEQQLLEEIYNKLQVYVSLLEGSPLALVTDNIAGNLKLSPEKRKPIDLTVYEVNLIFLYALYFPNDKKHWTLNFRDALEAVVYLINDLDNSSDESNIKILKQQQGLKKSSYPAVLVMKLLFLLWAHDNNVSLPCGKDKPLIKCDLKRIIQGSKSSVLDTTGITAGFINYLATKQLLTDASSLLEVSRALDLTDWSNFITQYFKDAISTYAWICKNINDLMIILGKLRDSYVRIFFKIISSLLSEDNVNELWNRSDKTSNDVLVISQLCSNDKINLQILTSYVETHANDVATFSKLLLVSAERGYLDSLKYLIEKGAKLDEKNNRGQYFIDVLSEIEAPVYNVELQKQLFELIGNDKTVPLPVRKYIIGMCYASGFGCDCNPKKAFKHYKRSATQGNSNAQYRVGRCYEKGIGREKDSIKSVKYYELSATQGNSNAQYRLGRCYEKGIGCDCKPKKAFKYYKRSATQGNSNAQYRLGRCYEKGIGREKDSVKSVKYYELSANQGHPKASAALNNLNSGSKNTLNYYENKEGKSNVNNDQKKGNSSLINPNFFPKPPNFKTNCTDIKISANNR